MPEQAGGYIPRIHLDGRQFKVNHVLQEADKMLSLFERSTRSSKVSRELYCPFISEM